MRPAVLSLVQIVFIAPTALRWCYFPVTAAESTAFASDRHISGEDSLSKVDGGAGGLRATNRASGKFSYAVGGNAPG